MNEFVSWCRHLLVSFLFHALTSLHPPSFHRNDFSTCSTHFSLILVQSPEMFSLRRAHVNFMHAHAHADNLHVRKWRRSVSAVEEPYDLPKEFTAKEKRTLRVRAHLRRLWRRLVKKSAPRLALVRR